MNIKLQKDVFRSIIAKYPLLNEIFIKEYQRKKDNAESPKGKIKIVIKPKDSLGAQMFFILDESQVVEARILQKKLYASQFVKELKKASQCKRSLKV